jgi:cytochrome c
MALPERSPKGKARRSASRRRRPATYHPSWTLNRFFNVAPNPFDIQDGISYSAHLGKEDKTMFRKVLIPVFVSLLVATSAYAQGYGIGTPVEAKKMVEKAVAYIEANGEEKALKEFNNPGGKFQWRDLYVFAYDLHGVIMGHPNPQLIGQNLYSTPDSKGKLFRKEIVDLANSRGSGWVDYTYMNPLDNQEEFKITHFQKVGNLIVCCGAYLP